MSNGKTEHERLLEEVSQKLLRKVGMNEGMSVLDVGCGSGRYTIPAAKVYRSISD